MRTNKGGFTLIEIVFALGVFAAGMLIIWQSFLAVYGALSSAKNMRTAAEILHNQLYEIQSGGYAEGRTAPGRSGEDGFYIVRDIKSVRTDLDEIRVEIFWKEKGKEKSAFATTFLSKPRR